TVCKRYLFFIITGRYIWTSNRSKQENHIDNMVSAFNEIECDNDVRIGIRKLEKKDDKEFCSATCMNKYYKEDEMERISLGVESFIEYIPEERFQNIKYMSIGGFATIYTAEWMDGQIESIDFIKSSIKRKGPQLVALKTMPKTVWDLMRSFGVSYFKSLKQVFLVMKLYEEDARSLIARDYWKLLWSQRLMYLCSLIFELSGLHNEGPEIPKNTPSAYAKLMTQCWDSNPDKRPIAYEILTNISRLLHIINDFLRQLFLKPEISNKFEEVFDFLDDDMFRMTRPPPENIIQNPEESIFSKEFNYSAFIKQNLNSDSKNLNSDSFKKRKRGNKEKYEPETEVQEEMSEDAIRQKIKEFNIQLDQNQNDVNLWLEFIAFQDKSLQFGKSKKADASITRSSINEVKISIFEKALEANPNDTSLLIAYMKCCEEHWDIPKLLTKWDQVLKENSRNINLWMKYLDFRQTNLVSFTVNQCIQVFEDCLHLLRKEFVVCVDSG
ncbi:16798_t:CDS:2, partial [Gigaspora rosea]